MKVLRIRALRGPNLWSQHTSIEATIVCSGLENNIDTIPSFEARLRERFPEISLLQPAGHHEAVTIAHFFVYVGGESYSENKFTKSLL